MNADETLLTPAQLAGRLGISKTRVLVWHRQGKIPAEIALGKIIRFSETEVRTVLKAAATDRKEVAP